MTNSEDNITVERLELKPEWVENPGPESGDYFRPLILFFLGIFIILLILGGGLEEPLATILTIWISLFFVFSAVEKTKDLTSWKRIRNTKEKQNLPLKKTSDKTERAVEGLELSQMLIEKNLRKNLMEKIKKENSLSEKEMRQLMEKPSELKKVINDDELFDFMKNSKTIEDLSKKKTKSLLSKVNNLFTFSKDINRKKTDEKGFEKKMKRTIRKITEWES
ncbi:MAG: hypothetical protein ACOCTN_02705 [Candidatus Natronoplasma sp.]